MEAKEILHADVLDILFEGRNKAYGAYALRRTYDRRLYYALAGTALVCLLFIVADIFASGKRSINNKLTVTGDVFLESVKDRKTEPVKPPPPKALKPPVAMAKVTIPKIVPNEQFKKEDEVVPADDLTNIRIGGENVTGKIDDIVDLLLEQGSSKTQLPLKEETQPEGPVMIQLEAQFPGGAAAWSRFLEQNLNSEIPVDNAAPAGRYTVIVSFVVDKDGSISEITALNDPGFGTAEEAVRVIKKSRQWTPALQNGRNVPYRQKQSITFEVSEN